MKRKDEWYEKKINIGFQNIIQSPPINMWGFAVYPKKLKGKIIFPVSSLNPHTSTNASSKLFILFFSHRARFLQYHISLIGISPTQPPTL